MISARQAKLAARKAIEYTTDFTSTLNAISNGIETHSNNGETSCTIIVEKSLNSEQLNYIKLLLNNDEYVVTIQSSGNRHTFKIDWSFGASDNDE